MRKLLLLILLVFLGAFLFAEEPMDNSTFEYPEIKGHYIGAVGGMTLGYGLTYRYWPEKLGFQFTLTPHVLSDSSGFIAGTAGFLTLHEARKNRLYLYAGGSYGYSYIDDSWEDSSRIKHDIGLSTGPGFELYLGENIALDLMLGYGFSTLFDGLTFTAETGIFYRF